MSLDRNIDGAPVCEACFQGDHDECSHGNCMCIDMEHDDE